MMWKCPVCRYENKITRFCLRCGYNGDHGQSPDAPAASGKGGCPAPQQEQNLPPVQWLDLAKQEQDPTKRIAYLKKAAEPRPSAGSAGPPSRATPRHSMCWAFAAKEAKA